MLLTIKENTPAILWTEKSLKIIYVIWSQLYNKTWMKGWKEIQQNVYSDSLWARNEVGFMSMFLPFSFVYAEFIHYSYNQKKISIKNKKKI